MHLFTSAALRRTALATLLLAGTTLPSTGQDLKAPLPFDPAVTKGKLANGLTYYIRTNKKPADKVELRLIVKAGSINEDKDQLGLAHFMEHMNFNGLAHFQKNELVDYLQSIGVQFGADLNAYTSFDQTVYILPIPTDKPGNLEKGFQIIEDWAHAANLTDKDIEEERAVVLEESRLGKGADDRMLKKYFPKYAAGTLYAERLPIGKDDILKTFKYDAIRRYYKDWYRPNLQAVAIVGDIDKETAMKLLQEHFGGLTNPATERPRTYQEVKPRTKAEAMVVTDKEATNYSLQLMFPHIKKEAEATIGDYRESIKRQLTLSMINQRLNDLAQSSTPPFPFAAVGFDDMIHGYESLMAFTMFGPEGPAKASDALTAELLRAKSFGFTASEIDRAKKELMSNMEKAYNERKTTNSKDYVEEYIRNFLDEEPMPGIENEFNYYKQLLPGIAAAELNELPKKWMANMNTFTLITGPDKQTVKLPTDAALAALTAKGFTQKVAAAKEEKVANTLMEKLPAAGKVVSKSTEEGLEATTYVLSNGVKVTVKPTDFKSDEILLKGIKKGGTNSYSAADKASADYAANVVDAMGVAGFTPTELEKVMAGKTARVSMDLSEINDYVSGNSSVKDFESMLQLVNLYITQPRKDEALFTAFKDKQKSQLQFLSGNPQVTFIDTLFKTLYNGNPLASSPIPRPADFDKINLARALEIYKNEIGTADGYHFFIVGNVQPETALPLIETYLGSIPAANKQAAYKDNGVRPITGDHLLKVNKGKEKQSLIIAQYFGEVPYSEDLSLKAQALAGILNIKVIEELREKMGGIYTGGFNANVRKEPYERYSIGLQLPCGPENVDKLLAAAKEEIEVLKTKGPEAKDLDKVKSQWREKYRTEVKENKFWQDKLESVLFWGRDKQHVTGYEGWIEKITPADIQETARLLFNGKNQFISVLYPES